MFLTLFRPLVPLMRGHVSHWLVDGMGAPAGMVPQTPNGEVAARSWPITPSTFGWADGIRSIGLNDIRRGSSSLRGPLTENPWQTVG